MVTVLDVFDDDVAVAMEVIVFIVIEGPLVVVAVAVVVDRVCVTGSGTW